VIVSKNGGWKKYAKNKTHPRINSWVGKKIAMKKKNCHFYDKATIQI